MAKQLEHEVNDSSLSNTEVKIEGSYTSAPPICLHGVDLYLRYVCTNLSSFQVS